MSDLAVVAGPRLHREIWVTVLSGAGHEVPVRAASVAELCLQLAEKQVDLVLIATACPAPDDVAEIIRRDPSARVLVLGSSSAREGRSAHELLAAGARTYLSREETSLGQLLASVAAAVGTETYLATSTIEAQGGLLAAPALRQRLSELDVLTARERQVLAHLGRGSDNLKIGALLGISERTVKAHVSALYRKLKVENRVELALLATRAGLQPIVGAVSELVSTD